MSAKKNYYNPNLLDLEEEFDKYLHLANEGTGDATVSSAWGEFIRNSVN